MTAPRHPRDPNGGQNRGRNRTQIRTHAERHGRWAERWVGLLLNLQGYRVVARRYRCPYGEIDLIVTGRRQLRFVEVKYRRAFTPGQLDQILPSPHARQRIRRSARHYLGLHPPHDALTVHIDAVIVTAWGRTRWFRDSLSE